MDKVSFAVGVIVFSIILGVYYLKIPVTESYINGTGKMPVVTEQHYSADYLYKNRPSAAPSTPDPTTAADTTNAQNGSK